MPNVSEVFFFYVGNCAPFYYSECRIAYWLWRTVPFVLLVIGTIGNILNICVLSRQPLRRFSTGVFFLTLAISEITFLWSGLLPDTIYSITAFRFEDQSEIFCRTRWWWALTSASFSVWVLVLLTLERTLLTKAPVFSRNYLTAKHAAISAFVVFMIIVCVNSHLIFGFTLGSKNAERIHRNQTGNSAVLPCDFISTEYKLFYERTWSIFVFVLYTLLPAVIIITGNINIALVLLSRTKRRAKIVPAVAAKKIAEDRQKSSAKMLFILSIIFLITTMPYCIYFVVRGQIEQMSDRSVARWQLITVSVNILGWCNFTFNFFFYFVSGTLFKQEWQKLRMKIQESVSRVVKS